MEEKSQYELSADLLDAIYNGDPAGVKKAISDGADVDYLSGDDVIKRSPLTVAVLEGNPEILQILLDAGANTEIPLVGYSFFHRVVETRNPELLAIALKQKGVNVNKQDSDGNTLLHLASSDFTGEMAKMLVAAGADVIIKNNKGQTPMDLAKQNPRMEEVLKIPLEKINSFVVEVGMPGVREVS